MFSKSITRGEYAIAVGWRLGLFVAVTVAFPFALAGTLTASKCAGVGGACGALALVIGLYVKPIVFLVFLASLIGISLKRARDLGVPGAIGLLVPALLLADWQFATIVGAPWSVGFVLGGVFRVPYHFLSALLCIGFLCCAGPADESGQAASDRFGVVGKLALSVSVVIAAVGLMRLGVFGMIMAGGLKTALRVLSVVAQANRIVPWAVLMQAGLLGYLLWQDRAPRNNTPRPTPKVLPRSSFSRPVFGQRG